MSNIQPKKNNFQKNNKRQNFSRSNNRQNKRGQARRTQIDVTAQLEKLTAAFIETPPATQTEMLALLQFYVDAMPQGAVRNWLAEFERIFANMMNNGGGKI